MSIDHFGISGIQDDCIENELKSPTAIMLLFIFAQLDGRTFKFNNIRNPRD